MNRDCERRDEEFERLMAQGRIGWKDVRTHIVGPVVSLLAHVVLLFLVMALFVGRPPEKQTKAFAYELTTVDVKDYAPPPELEKLDLDEPVASDAPALDRPDLKAREIQTVIEQIPDVAVPDTPDIVVFDTSALNIKENTGMLKLPVAFAGRLNAASRGMALDKYGVGPKTEVAVNKALDWLVKRQNADGSWGDYPGTRKQYTALALLAFLGHGETPVSEKYGPAIVKAIVILLRWVDEAGPNGQIGGDGYTYTHPVVVYALAEAYGMTRMPRLKQALNRCVRPVIDGANPHGAYWSGYINYRVPPPRNPLSGSIPPRSDHKPEYHSDIAFTAWNCQALKAAYAAGCDAEGLEARALGALDGLRRLVGQGAFDPAKGDFGAACMLAFSMDFLGGADKKDINAGRSFVLKDNEGLFERCSWRFDPQLERRYPKAFTNATLVWYFQTMAAFQSTKGVGSLWRRWVKSFSLSLVREQEADGRWSTPAQKYGDKLDPKVSAEWTNVLEFKDERDLEVFATCYNCLTLEVFYRYLPTHKAILASGKKPQSKVAAKDDLGLEIM